MINSDGVWKLAAWHRDGPDRSPGTVVLNRVLDPDGLTVV